jgi:cytochrome b subunit of formate dehydrogenase
MRLNTKEWI